MQKTGEYKPSLLSEHEYLTHIMSIAGRQGLAVACWRLPGRDTRHIILSNTVQKLPADHALEELPAGFIFSPFDTGKSSLFLEADYTFSFTEEQPQAPATPKDATSASWLAEQLKKAPAPPFRLPRRETVFREKDKQAFTALVQKSLDAIEQGMFEKVVPSRVRNITLPQDFTPVGAFRKLCSAYPRALVSLVHIPGTGTWLGASPETLVSVENRSVFRTVALAGTQPYTAGTNLRSVAWTQKEIEEQALVERYIISCFKKIRLREYEEHGPKTVVAGNLMHLRSDFTVDMKATNFPQLGSVMLRLLHPTSAVCGTPLAPALAFIREHEDYDRGFYTGYLGPVNVHHDTHIFVNLRCMQLFENSAALYAGAGVTRDSDPEKEWEETEIKLNTLLNVIC